VYYNGTKSNVIKKNAVSVCSQEHVADVSKVPPQAMRCGKYLPVTRQTRTYENQCILIERTETVIIYITFPLTVHRICRQDNCIQGEEKHRYTGKDQAKGTEFQDSPSLDLPPTQVAGQNKIILASNLRFSRRLLSSGDANYCGRWLPTFRRIIFSIKLEE
jgi:hypothetical protein